MDLRQQVEQAAWPMPSLGCATVVSGGVSKAPKRMPSKPQTEMSAGTDRPSPTRSAMTAVASKSLEQNSAVGACLPRSA